MKAVGVIAEWHPFHNGHAYQLKEAKRLAGADLVVGVMSGNFVQRGEPAMLSKWDRAEVALQNGCDLVVELPFWYATQPADIFAKGGVTALAALDCDAISFGVEDPHFADFQILAEWMVHHPKAVEVADTLVNQEDNKSFAEKRIAAIQYLQAQHAELANLNIAFNENANTLLAFAYAKTNAALAKPLQMVAVNRIGDNHRLEKLAEKDLASRPETKLYTSGSAIRSYLASKRDTLEEKRANLSRMVPQEMVHHLLTAIESDALITWEDLFDYLKYRLKTASKHELMNIYQVIGGMENRMIETIKQVDDFDEFVAQVKNRNWSINRVQRTALMIVLNVLDVEIAHALDQNTPQPLMVLAATEKGRKHLKQVKKTLSDEDSRWQLVSRVDKQVEEKWPLWLKADGIYEILKPNVSNQNFNHPPIFYK